ncbi:MAG: hypothetical protein ACOX55_13290 [Christensenellales bacterium]
MLIDCLVLVLLMVIMLAANWKLTLIGLFHPAAAYFAAVPV